MTELDRYPPTGYATVALAGVTNHLLSIHSEPSGIPFKLDGNDKTTPLDNESIIEGSHILTMPQTVILSDVTYYFQKWTDEVTTATRTINLIADSTLVAVYATQPPFDLTRLLIIGGILGAVVVTAAIAYKT